MNHRNVANAYAARIAGNSPLASLSFIGGVERGYGDALDAVRAASAIGAVIRLAGCVVSIPEHARELWAESDWTVCLRNASWDDPGHPAYLAPDER